MLLVLCVSAVDQVSDSPIYELDDDDEDTEEKSVNNTHWESKYELCVLLRPPGDGIWRYERLLPTT